MNIDSYNPLTPLYNALLEAITSRNGDETTGVEQKINALATYIQKHTTDLSKNLVTDERQRQIYEDITTAIQSLENPSGKILLKEIQSLFFKTKLLKLEELAKNPDQLVSWLNEREGGRITREDLNSSAIKVLNAFDKVREFSTLPQELQSEFDKTLSKMVVCCLGLENKNTEELAILFQKKQIDPRALASFVNAKEIALKDLKLPIESLNQLAPYLNYVNCRDIKFKNGDEAQNFIENCSKAYQIFINSDKIKEIKKLPKALEQLYCSSCTSLTTLNLQGLTGLKELHCSNCTSLRALNLQGLISLETLDCEICTSLTTLNLQGLISLETIDFRICTSLTTLNLQDLTALKGLYCVECTSLTTLNLQGLTALEGVYCPYCTSLTTLNLQGLTALEKLYCRGCTSLTTLPLEGLTALKEVDCEGCESFTTLSFLGLEALRAIRCDNCRYLTSLGDSMPNTLQNLYCENCPNLAQLPQVPPTANVYSGNSRCGNLNRFEVNPLDIEQKPLELLLRLGEILLQNKPFPNIVYIDPLTGQQDQRVDAGGLRRQFIYDLSQRLFKKESGFPFIEKLKTAEGNFPILDLTNNTQVLALRTLARLIAFAATSEALITGPLLSQNFYSAVLLLAKDPELSRFKTPLTEQQKKEIYLIAEYGFKTEDVISYDEEPFLAVGDPIAIVAQEIKGLLQQKLEAFTLNDFIAKVEGITVTSEILLGSIHQGVPRIKFNTEIAPQIKEFLERFIKENDAKQTLKDFVKFVAGSPSLGLEEQIKVHVLPNASTSAFPITHTCFQSIEFPLYETYEVFEEKLLLALKAKDSFGMI